MVAGGAERYAGHYDLVIDCSSTTLFEFRNLASVAGAPASPLLAPHTLPVTPASPPGVVASESLTFDGVPISMYGDSITFGAADLSGYWDSGHCSDGEWDIIDLTEDICID